MSDQPEVHGLIRGLPFTTPRPVIVDVGRTAVADQITVLATRVAGMWSDVDPGSARPKLAAR